MNETPIATPVAILASYVEGRKDGFQSGFVCALGVVVLYKAWRKRNQGTWVRFGKNNKI